MTRTFEVRHTAKQAQAFYRRKPIGKSWMFGSVFATQAKPYIGDEPGRFRLNATRRPEGQGQFVVGEESGRIYEIYGVLEADNAKRDLEAWMARQVDRLTQQGRGTPHANGPKRCGQQ